MDKDKIKQFQDKALDALHNQMDHILWGNPIPRSSYDFFCSHNSQELINKENETKNNNTVSAPLTLASVMNNMIELANERLASEIWVYKNSEHERNNMTAINPKLIGRAYPDKMIIAHPDDYDRLKIEFWDNPLVVFKSEPKVDYDKLREEAEE